MSFWQGIESRESKLSSFHLEFSFNSIRYICLLFYCLVTFGFLWHKFCFKKIHWSDNLLYQAKSAQLRFPWPESAISYNLSKNSYVWATQWPTSSEPKIKFDPSLDRTLLKIIENCGPKNHYVWAAQWPTFSEVKIKFDPSLDRSWCEFFKILKNHGPKNWPLGCNFGPMCSPSGW